MRGTRTAYSTLIRLLESFRGHEGSCKRHEIFFDGIFRFSYRPIPLRSNQVIDIFSMTSSFYKMKISIIKIISIIIITIIINFIIIVIDNKDAVKLTFSIFLKHSEKKIASVKTHSAVHATKGGGARHILGIPEQHCPTQH